MTKHILFLCDDVHPIKVKKFSLWKEKAEALGDTVQLEVISSKTACLPALKQTFDVLIEWTSQRNQLKQTVLELLEPYLSENTVILSSAHDTNVSTIASWLPYPNNVIGFSPMGLFREPVTVSLSLPFNAPHTVQKMVDDLLKSWDSIPVWIEETPGMVLPRIYAMLVNEAAFALQEQVATASDIDTAMKLGTNYPMGPLAWADMVGIDEVLAILENLWHTYHEERYRPCPLLLKMVSRNILGQSTGQGFFNDISHPVQPPTKV